MPTFKSSAAAALVATAVASTALVTAGPASAASWHCKTSSKSLDMPQYDGPWPDNTDFTVKTCAKRAGSYVYGKSKVSWDAPATYGQVRTFDSASFRLAAGKARKNFGLTSKRLEKDGSLTTSTLKSKVGKHRSHAVGALRLNWNDDGAGTKNYKFSRTPKV